MESELVKMIIGSLETNRNVEIELNWNELAINECRKLCETLKTPQKAWKLKRNNFLKVIYDFSLNSTKVYKSVSTEKLINFPYFFFFLF